ncbi:MAG TPA: cytochrome d ubiquinol oxidase subunit II, partial [Acidimicrobiia bacterium]
MITTAAVILWVAVTAYAVFGGADYGAGFWTLVSAPGPRGERPRALIRHAVGPVWEANHVWLIYAIVLLWTAFPRAFESVMSSLFVPLALAVIGIVLRGSAFAFGGVTASPAATRAWTWVYGVSSVVVPFLLGAVLGGIASGRVEPGNATSQALSTWINPTSIVVGLFAVTICAYVAAVFLTTDARHYRDEPLVAYFRRRAILAGIAAGVLSVVGIFVLGSDSPYMRSGLLHEGLVPVIASALFGITALSLLRRGTGRWTRALAVGAVAMVVWAWGLAQYPYALPETLTIQDAAGNIHTLSWVLLTFVLATVFVIPALVLLFVLDQRGKLEEGMDPSAGMAPHRVVIVGGGFGGLPAARFLGHTQVEVVLVDRRNHHLFQPLLYQVATGILSPGEIAPSLRHQLRHHKNVNVELAAVTGFDLERRVVYADRFFETPVEIPYDSLIVAAGAGQSYFGHDEFALNAPGMKTIDDAMELRRRIFGALEMAESSTSDEEREQWMTIVVVGAGPTGVELAGQIRELAQRSLRGDFRAIDPSALRVLLLDGGEEPLATFGDRLSDKATEALEHLGVELRMGSRVTAVD